MTQKTGPGQTAHRQASGVCAEPSSPLSDHQRFLRMSMRKYSLRWRCARGSEKEVANHALLNAIHCRRMAQNETGATY